MKEITRIHLAKTPYSIELEARRRLEKYLAEVKTYAGDADILDDIEIRMTELLAERGVQADGVVTMADVEALEEQLGEPQAFASDETGMGGTGAGGQHSVHRLFRDRRTGRLGGVASGIAEYFGIDPVWMRLMFIVAAFASFGAVCALYVLMWAIIPPVQSPSDQLQLEGRPVTIESIRGLAGQTFDTGKARESQLVRLLTGTLGVLCVLGALGSVIATVGVVLAVVLGHQLFASELAASPGVMPVYIGLGFMAAAGILLSLLFAIAARAFFTRRLAQRMVVAGVVIVALGLVSFGAGIGFARSSSEAVRAAIIALTTETTYEVPAGFQSINSFTASATDRVDVRYVVTDGQPKVVVKQVAQRGRETKPDITVHGTSASLEFHYAGYDQFCIGWCSDPVVTVYGPRLASATVQQGALYYHATTQAALDVTAHDRATFVLDGGQIDNLTLALGEGSDAIAGNSSVTNIKAKLKANGSLRTGIVQSLVLDMPAVCPSSGRATVNVAGVNSRTITLNGQPVPAKASELSCASVSLENED